MMSDGKLVIVTLDCPYEVWDNPEATNLFQQIISLKKRGYQQLYPHGCVPLDKTDFIGTHHVVCLQNEKSLTPIMIAKTITYERCMEYKITFPALGMLESANAKHHVTITELALEKCKTEGKGITYSGGWTIDPLHRDNIDLKKEAFNLYTALHTQYHIDHEITDVIGAGNVRFKANKFFEKWGAEPFFINNMTLPPVKLKDLEGEEVIMVHLKKFSEECLKITQKYKPLWDKRIIFENKSTRKNVKHLMVA